jgi:hypothetical protein
MSRNVLSPGSQWGVRCEGVRHACAASPESALVRMKARASNMSRLREAFKHLSRARRTPLEGPSLQYGPDGPGGPAPQPPIWPLVAARSWGVRTRERGDAAGKALASSKTGKASHVLFVQDTPPDRVDTALRSVMEANPLLKRSPNGRSGATFASVPRHPTTQLRSNG